MKGWNIFVLLAWTWAASCTAQRNFTTPALCAVNSMCEPFRKQIPRYNMITSDPTTGMCKVRCTMMVQKALDAGQTCDWNCGQPSTDLKSCGAGCVCDVDTEGRAFCLQGDKCANLPSCRTSIDCPQDQRCMPNNCCSKGRVCVRACGVAAVASDAISATGPDSLETYSG